jgi:hypothetical protein
LGNITDLLAIVSELDILDVLSIDKDLSFVGIVESFNELNARTLSRSGRSNNSGGLAHFE